MGKTVSVRVRPSAPNNILLDTEGGGEAIHMLTMYFPILVFFTIGILLPCALLIAGYFLVLKPVARSVSEKEKRSPYECGFEPFEDARLPFDIRFYLVAILFILFDLETAFLFPWAISLHSLGWLGFVNMLIFLLILTIGFVYEWKKGALEWK